MFWLGNCLCHRRRPAQPGVTGTAGGAAVAGTNLLQSTDVYLEQKMHGSSGHALWPNDLAGLEADALPVRLQSEIDEVRRWLTSSKGSLLRKSQWGTEIPNNTEHYQPHTYEALDSALRRLRQAPPPPALASKGPLGVAYIVLVDAAEVDQLELLIRTLWRKKDTFYVHFDVDVPPEKVRGLMTSPSMQKSNILHDQASPQPTLHCYLQSRSPLYHHTYT